MDILAGLKNIFGSVASSIISSATVVEAPNVDVPAPSGNGTISNIGATFKDAEAAYGEIHQLIADIENKDIEASADDVLDLIKDLFRILDRYGVNIPIVSSVVKALPDLDPVK